MRKTNFRGYATGTGWVYGSLVNNLWTYSKYSQQKEGTPVFEIITGNYEGDCWNDIAEQEGLTIISVVPESVGEFTGLKDKNGKDVYEGDIVKSFYNDFYGEINSVIEWYDKECKFGIRTNFKSGASALSTLGNYLSKGTDQGNLEIVGNIYENLELLKKVGK